MTGDPPEFPAPWEPVTHRQIQDLLKSACTIGRPYLILAHSTDLVTAVLLLRELHTTACLQWLQVNLWDKLVKLSFCPFCTYVGVGWGGNDLSYLNHIIIVHYNTSYGCGRCLKQASISSSALHTHKKVCLEFSSRKWFWMANLRVVEVTVATGVLPKPPLKRMARGPPLAPRVQAPPWPLSLHHTTVDGGPLTTTSPTRRMPAKGGKMWAMRAWPERVLGTRLARMGVTAKQAPCRYSQSCDTFQ